MAGKPWDLRNFGLRIGCRPRVERRTRVAVLVREDEILESVVAFKTDAASGLRMVTQGENTVERFASKCPQCARQMWLRDVQGSEYNSFPPG